MTYVIDKQLPLTAEGGPPDEDTALHFLREWTKAVKDAYEEIGDLGHSRKHKLESVGFLDDDRPLFQEVDLEVIQQVYRYRNEGKWPTEPFKKDRIKLINYVKNHVVRAKSYVSIT